MSKPRFYSARNYLSTAIHFTGAVGLGFASYSFAQPWALITASAFMIPVYAISLFSAKKQMETGLVEHDKSYSYSPKLGQIMEDLYNKSGITSKNYPVYNFEELKTAEEVGAATKHKKPSFLNLMKKIPNAAAFSMGKPVIMISEPLLKLLNDDEEERAVLAHEFSHINSKHLTLTLPIKILQSVSRMANALTVVSAAISTGFWKFVGVTAGSVIAANTIKKMTPYSQLLATDNKDLTVKEIYQKKKIERLIKPFTMAAMLGGMAYINPSFPLIWLTSRSIGVGNKLLTASFSRSNEYQADKGAIALDANPLALISSLRKIDALMQRGREKAWGNEPVPQPGMLRKAWKDATATHPSLTNRIARLSDMARKQGYDEDTIRIVVSRPVDISHAEDIPYETLKAMVIAL